MKINWLHLSDLHFRCKPDNFESDLIYSALLDDIKNIEEKIDCVFITGDIAYSGEAEEYKRASDFFKKIAEVLKIPRENFFFVPGNHDIQRSSATRHITKIILSANSEQEVSEILGNKELKELFLKRQNNYYDFVSNNAFKIDKSELFYTKNIIVDGINIAIVGLNSAWCSESSNEKGQIILGERQVLEAFSKIENAQIVITLLHHPIYYFKDEDVEKVETIINERSDFVLHGHIHNGKVISQEMLDSIVYYLVSGASYENNNFRLSYNYTSVDLSKGKVAVYLRRYDDRKRAWIRDDSNVKNGEYTLHLTNRLLGKDTSTYGYVSDNKVSYVREEVKKYNVDRSSFDSKSLIIPKMPETLLECIKEGNCVLFAGAGASMDAKMPSWRELVFAFIEKLKKSYPSFSDSEIEEIEKLFTEEKYMILAAYSLKKLGAYDFSDVLKHKLSCQGKTSDTHDILAKIPFKAVITPNFDLFVEKTNSKNGRFCSIILPNDMNVSEDMLGDALPVLKIHGSYEQPKSIVLNKADFRDLLFHKPEYIEALKNYFIKNTIFFYGYSFKDPDVDFILQSIMADKKGHAKKHYALLPNVGDIEAEYLLQDYNIQVISYSTEVNGHLAAREFIKKIVESL